MKTESLSDLAAAFLTYLMDLVSLDSCSFGPFCSRVYGKYKKFLIMQQKWYILVNIVSNHIAYAKYI
ncbi:MAG: hypothetical protein Q4E24_05565 [bacterium]|nr:hypothetical protein [bacterium]